MLPERLQSSEGPAKALAYQRVGSLGSDGAADGLVIEQNAPTVAPDRQRQVRILGDRVTRKPSARANDLCSPGADRAGHDGDAVEQIERPFLEVLPADVLERLPARQPSAAVGHLGVAGDACHVAIDEVPDELPHRRRVDLRVGIDREQDFAALPRQPHGSAPRIFLGSVGGSSRTRGSRANRAATISLVASRDPSSTTITSKLA